MEKLLTVDEVASILRVSEQMVRWYLKNEELKGLKLKREWRIKESDLNEFIERNMNVKENE